VVGGFFSMCVIVGAPFAVTVIGGPKYHASIAVLEILGIGVVGTFLVATWSFALLTLRLYRELITINAIVVVLGIALSLVLIPAHEANGGGVVTATLELMLAACYAAVLHRRRPELRPSLALVPRVVLAFAIAFAVAFAVPVSSVFSLAAGTVVLFACLIVLGALPAEFLQALRRRPAAG
jgi:O-antigen/teichoic acid export membrane protein